MDHAPENPFGPSPEAVPVNLPSVWVAYISKPLTSVACGIAISAAVAPTTDRKNRGNAGCGNEGPVKGSIAVRVSEPAGAPWSTVARLRAGVNGRPAF